MASKSELIDDVEVGRITRKIQNRLAYNEKYRKNNGKTGEMVTKFMKNCFPKLRGVNDPKPFEDADFIKALSEIANKSGDGMTRINYAFEVLRHESETILPRNPYGFRRATIMLDKLLDDIIAYGIKNDIIEVASSGTDVKKAINNI